MAPVGPLRAFRDRYVAAYGGVSYDLAPAAIGIDPDALHEAPDLEGREVLVSPGRGPPTPLSRRPAFLVVALTHAMRNARELAGRSRVVFSTFALDDPATARVIDSLRLDDPVFLNASIGRLPDAGLRRPRFDAS